MTFDRLDPDLLSALLEAQLSHSATTIIVEGESTVFNSSLLGFDYYENTLLIDGLSPPLDVALRNKLENIPFWLQIKHPRGYINLSCVLVGAKHELYTLQMLDGELTQNRRWQSRLIFNARSGPTTKFWIKQNLPVEGTLHDISVGGASVDFFGKDTRSSIARNNEYTFAIQFNEQFTLSLTGIIKQNRFKREPCCHSRARVVFTRLDEVVRSQLINFIDNTLDESAAA